MTLPPPMFRAVAASTTLAATLAFTPQAHADLFSLEIVTNGVTASRTFGKAEDAVDTINESGYASINEAYTETSIARVNLGYRGLPVIIDYPTDGAELTFTIPSIGERQVFNGATRDESEDQLEDFLENNRDGLLTRVLNALASQTATDPVAGNPTSLQSKSIADDFSMGTSVGTAPSNRGSNKGGSSEESEGEGAPSGLVGLNARLGRFSADGTDITVIDLPLRYVMPLDDPRYAFMIDFPLTYVDTDGAEGGSVSLGVGFRVPVYDNWTLTPAARIGATGSIDLGAVGVLASGSVTSDFRLELGGVNVSLGNMAGITQTVPLDVGYDEFEDAAAYDLTNFVLRNGISASGDLGVDLFGEPLTWQASAVNTQLFGDDLFIENYTDLAVSFGTEASKSGLTWDSMRLGLTYTFSDEDFDGFRVNFGYQF